MKLELLPNWKHELKTAWSIKVAAVSGLLSTVVTVWPSLADVLPPLTYAGLGIAFSLAFAVTKLLKQPGDDDLG